MIEILATGPLATVQDRGRGAWAELGVGRAGAFDRAALATANRLVGNAPDAAGLEIMLGGLTVRVHDAVTVALTGAPCPGLPWGEPITLPTGAVVRLGSAPTGLRAYLAVRGGVDASTELGSRSTDTMGGLGPAPLRPGDRLAVGHEATHEVAAHVAVPLPRHQVLRVLFGPRDDWFAPSALRTLTTTTWTVRPESDRVGIRLDGPSLERSRDGELPSEASLPGRCRCLPTVGPSSSAPTRP